MRKNILVYNDCSNIAEKLIPFCAGEGISVRKIVTGKKMEQFTYLLEAWGKGYLVG